MTQSMGKVLEVEFVANTRQGGVMASERIDGKFCFPDRRGVQPKVGEIWQVRVSGTNPSGSVLFLTCLNFVGTSADRNRVYVQKKDSEYSRFVRLSSIFEKQFESLSDKLSVSSVSAEGVPFPVSISLEHYQVSETGIVGNFEFKICVSEEFSYFFKKKFQHKIGWNEVLIVKFTSIDEDISRAYFEFKFQNFPSHPVLILPTFLSQTSFVRFECLKSEVYGVYTASLPYGKTVELKTLLCQVVLDCVTERLVRNDFPPRYVGGITPAFTEFEESFVNALLNPVSVVAPQVETVETSVEVETELEKVQVETLKEVDLDKLIQSLILFRDGQVALTGFRYADTGNSVVLAKIGASWAIHEFDKSDFSISRRRGAGSFRCVANSLEPKEVFRCIEHYISFGWELVEDDDSENVAGALILKFLPEEVENVLMGS